GGHDQVAFVLAVLVVDDDDHAAGAEFFKQFGDGGERHGTATWVGILRGTAGTAGCGKCGTCRGCAASGTGACREPAPAGVSGDAAQTLQIARDQVDLKVD